MSKSDKRVHLIINADDFGMSNRFNDCIIRLLAEKKITSTTVMVNRISDSQKVKVQELRYLMETHDISVGLHIEFTYDRYLEQVSDQHRKFIDLFGVGPTHLDVHKEHLHRKYHSIVAKFCRSKELSFRNHGRRFTGVATTAKKYFYGSVDEFEPIDKWLKGLAKSKCYELVFHPGQYDPYCFSSLNRERERDIDYIERIYENLEMYNVQLASFNHFKELQFA